MINDENYPDWIARFYAGTLTPQEVSLLQEYLAKSFHLSRQQELDRELTEFLSDPDLLEFRDVVKKSISEPVSRRRPNFFLMAATIAFFVAFSSIAWYQVRFYLIHPVSLTALYLIETVGSPIVETPDETAGHGIWGTILPFPGTTTISTVEISDCFTPMPYLESLVGIVTRAGSFSLFIPHDSICLTPGTPLRFVWRDRSSADCSLEIFNNKGIRIWEGENMQPGEWIISTVGWGKGLYYWRIVRNESVTGAGKIILRP